MKLAEYLTRQNLLPQAFAERIGVSGEAVRLWINGSRTPRPAQMQAILAATNGAVTPNDFLPERASPATAETPSPFSEAAP